MHPLLQLDNHRNQLIQVPSLSSKVYPFPCPSLFTCISPYNQHASFTAMELATIIIIIFFHIILAKAVTSTYMFMNFNRTYSFLCGS